MDEAHLIETLIRCEDTDEVNNFLESHPELMNMDFVFRLLEVSKNLDVQASPKVAVLQQIMLAIAYVVAAKLGVELRGKKEKLLKRNENRKIFDLAIELSEV